jgi:CDGSH-type Zn-finger protein/uncharacterized Fe-S cluster protein YjdI
MSEKGTGRRKFLRRDYAGQEVTVSFDFKRCLHVKECVRRSPAAFEKDRRPWIIPDREQAHTVTEAVLACPTGALRVARHVHGETESVPATNTIWVMADGPLYLRGDLEIIDGKGQSLHRDTRLALCRCGHSQNKPFCDNAHLEVNFRAVGLRRVDVTRPPQESGEGRLRIEPTANGPYVVEGPVAIVGISEGGRTGEDIGQEDLCRCGHSGAKPFCNGSHRRVGFTAEPW